MKDFIEHVKFVLHGAKSILRDLWKGMDNKIPFLAKIFIMMGVILSIPIIYISALIETCIEEFKN